MQSSGHELQCVGVQCRYRQDSVAPTSTVRQRRIRIQWRSQLDMSTIPASSSASGIVSGTVDSQSPRQRTMRHRMPNLRGSRPRCSMSTGMMKPMSTAEGGGRRVKLNKAPIHLRERLQKDKSTRTQSQPRSGQVNNAEGHNKDKNENSTQQAQQEEDFGNRKINVRVIQPRIRCRICSLQ